jgi:hypothetical protein
MQRALRMVAVELAKTTQSPGLCSSLSFLPANQMSEYSSHPRPCCSSSSSCCSSPSSMLLLRLALYSTFPGVAFAADTVDGVGSLFLQNKNTRQSVQIAITSNSTRSPVSWRLTFKYSFVASCHSLVIVRGGGLAKACMIQKRTTETPIPIAV